MSDFDSQEKRMTAIENKISELTDCTALFPTSSSEVLLDYQEQLLIKLKSIREAMLNSNKGGGLTSKNDDRDRQLLAENISLKKDNEKLNYRISHLVKAVNTAEKSK